jgi:hypothetical protein
VPLGFFGGEVIDSSMTFVVSGNQADAKLVAARMPEGVGVWVMDQSAYDGGNGTVSAQNEVARSTTVWDKARTVEG